MSFLYSFVWAPRQARVHLSSTTTMCPFESMATISIKDLILSDALHTRTCVLNGRNPLRLRVDMMASPRSSTSLDGGFAGLNAGSTRPRTWASTRRPRFWPALPALRLVYGLARQKRRPWRRWSEIYVVIPMEPPNLDGRLSSNSASSASTIDLKPFVAAMFVLHYLKITPAQILRRSHCTSQRKQSVSRHCHTLLSNYTLVLASIEAAKDALIRSIGKRRADMILKAERWKHNPKTHVVNIKREHIHQVAPVATVAYHGQAVLGTLDTRSHRHHCDSTLKQGPGLCCRRAPGARYILQCAARHKQGAVHVVL